MKAFYFARTDRKLRYGDNRKIVVGETHTVDCTPEVCSKGLHASVNLFDALKYAPGPILYLVELDGDVDIGCDKVAATKRTYLAEFDATEVLREYARIQASYSVHLIKPYRTEDQYKDITHFLSTGENANAALDAALDTSQAIFDVSVSVSVHAAPANPTILDAYNAANAVYNAVDAALAAANTASDAAYAAAVAGALAAFNCSTHNKIPDQNETLTNMIREATEWDI